MLNALKQCKLYVEDYATGRQNLGKCVGVIYQTKEVIDGVCDELVKVHGLSGST